jgi:hypothetical protein
MLMWCRLRQPPWPCLRVCFRSHVRNSAAADGNGRRNGKEGVPLCAGRRRCAAESPRDCATGRAGHSLGADFGGGRNAGGPKSEQCVRLSGVALLLGDDIRHESTAATAAAAIVVQSFATAPDSSPSLPCFRLRGLTRASRAADSLRPPLTGGTAGRPCFCNGERFAVCPRVRTTTTTARGEETGRGEEQCRRCRPVSERCLRLMAVRPKREPGNHGRTFQACAPCWRTRVTKPQRGERRLKNTSKMLMIPTDARVTTFRRPEQGSPHLRLTRCLLLAHDLTSLICGVRSCSAGIRCANLMLGAAAAAVVEISARGRSSTL